jgi:predicted HTH domain antitoxin
MSLHVTLNLPADLEEKLRREHTDLANEVKQAFALELFRRGESSHFELSRVLGLDRFQTDAFLKRHNVVEGSLTMEDLEEQRQTLERVLGPIRR